MAERIHCDATFSADRRYRYTLSRLWSLMPPYLVVVGLNPSTADENADDPTIRRCIGFAKREGLYGLIMVNLFALRSTDPKALLRDPHPIGADNDAVLRQQTDRRDGSKVLCAWGAHPAAVERARSIYPTLGPLLYCLGTTKDGHPRHPLYVPADRELEQFTLCAPRAEEPTE